MALSHRSGCGIEGWRAGRVIHETSRDRLLSTRGNSNCIVPKFIRHTRKDDDDHNGMIIMTVLMTGRDRMQPCLILFYHMHQITRGIKEEVRTYSDRKRTRLTPS